ncbi:acetylglutamate kinase [Mechercharimyces sp. CAU 1602]|uniref:acetylglutamate kinase n=1 Tax=Mechercharimyces sp. CAU 1602 TaxID=2973933 RepID=UPI00216228DF|nr:acetylglutamate kinase [Mechercharimyces sp. CAU 1602]MCS1350072.1 acetylglutamate kinase [Mechercharimyces sp. CAU 1602]
MSRINEVAVIKVGGSVMAELHPTFYPVCVEMMRQGVQPVIVHGGGPWITQLMEKMNLSSRFVDGMRVTTAETMDVVEMVLAGKVNKRLVAQMERAGVPAVGVSGVDRQLLQATKQDEALGYVGKVKQVNPEILTHVMAKGWVPVIASLGVDEEGQRYNVNADTAAGAIADALQAKSLTLITDVPGILHGEGKEKEVVLQLTASEVEKWIATKKITGGMIPKVRAGVSALTHSLQEVIICGGKSTFSYTRETGLFGTRLIHEEVKTDGTLSDLCEA